MKPNNEQLKWIGMDFDNTIAENTGFPDFKMTEPVEGAKHACEALTSQGYKIIIHTARGWSDHSDIREFLKKHEIPYHDIVCGKLLALSYIDDRAIRFSGDWHEVLRNFIP